MSPPRQIQPLSPRPELRAFATRLWAFAGTRLLGSALLHLGMALTEGVGVMLLVPLLTLFGVGSQPGTAGIAAWLMRPFALFDLSPSPGLMLGLFVSLVGMRQGLKYLGDVHDARLRLEFVDDLRTDLFARLAAAEWGFLSHTRHGDLLHALGGEVTQIGFGFQSLQSLLVGAVLSLVYLLGAILLAPSLALLALLVTAALALLVFRGAQRRSLGRGRLMVGFAKALNHTIEQFLGSLKWAKAHALEGRHADRFRRQTRAARDNQIAHQRANAARQALFQFAAATALAGFAWLALAGQWPTAQWLVFVAVVARLLPLVATLSQAAQQVLHTLPAYANLHALEQDCARRAEAATTEAAPLTFREAITITELRFRHTPEQAGLHIPALRLDARRTYALVGPSGAGKTTLADLIAGLLIPGDGAIHIDGVPLDAAHRQAWRRRLAYVPQDAVPRDASVRDNLLFAAPEASEAELWAALTQAAAESFVRALGQGLDTVLGPRGVRLSGGERQRIALARALLRRPELLILDEATSALDAEHERRIQAAIERLHGELTLIVIAHRLSTVRTADRIAVLDAGTLVQWGSWDELAADADGLFARLLRADHR